MKNGFTLDNQLCYAIYNTNSQFTKMYTKVLHPFGITYPQYLVLLALWEEDEIAVKKLGERLDMGTGTLTPMIKRLESNGWVKRERAKSDERKVIITLEAKALQNRESINQAIAHEIKTCNIELAEYQALMEQLKNLQEKLVARA